jgi:4-amino-4-deoxy-L-arabinose transferase-like glycosyltransferase
VKSGVVFDWPDEMANNFFIKNFKETSSFGADEPLNALISNPYVHPRSVNIVNNAIVPMSFLGMPIVYGAIAKIISMYGVLFLTPLFAVLAVVLLSLIMRRLFGEIAGLFAAALCFIAPGFWYYANMAMLPNILFLFFLVAGIYLCIIGFNTQERRAKFILAGVAGLCIGFAIMTRVIEIVWVALILLILLIAYWREIKQRWPQIIVFCVGGLLPMLLMLHFNYEIYGKYFTFGYLRQDQPTFLSGLPTEFKVDANSNASWFKLVVAPFGLHLRYSLSVFWDYIVKLQWPFFTLALATIVWLFTIKKTKTEKLFLAIGLVVAGWLLLFYGNWVFSDKLVLKYNRLSSSYCRYFLPIYLLCSLAIALAMEKFQQLKFSRALRVAIVFCGVAGLLAFSTCAVMFNAEDGLLAQIAKIEKYQTQRAAAVAKIPENSLLIVDRADKIFWPDYKVAVFLNDWTIFPEMKKLLAVVPIYYYTEMAPANISQINTQKMKDFGLKFVEGSQIDDSFYIYKLTLK